MANPVELQTFSYFENMVSKPTWKDILFDLIASESIDPWNIDLIKLADDFLHRVRELERMDFVLQANVILAAAIMLRYKSNYLKSLSRQTDISEFLASEVVPEAEGREGIPELTLCSRIPPKRQFTLDEILHEMERIIKYDETERVTVPRGSIVEIVDLELPDHDIEQDMADVLQRIRQNTDTEGWSLFSRLVGQNDVQKIVYTLVCILHLVQNGTVDIRQDKMFGEIFIKLLN